MTDIILDVKDLKTWFCTKKGIVRAVDGVSYKLSRGEILGVVGESGSGKSVMGRSIIGIVKKPGKVVGGSINFVEKDGTSTDILKASNKQLKKYQGDRIAMIFQEPMSSLNPVLTIGDQMTEGAVAHRIFSMKEAKEKAIEMLDVVKVKKPADMMHCYPHQLSGGMRQRVMIAMSLMCSPDILIADEPTTALDVTIQAQIIKLLKELRDKTGMAIIFITHNMGVISEISDNVLVMYCGKTVEYGNCEDVIDHPEHPYTIALLKAIPKLDEEREYLPTIPGIVPNLIGINDGCRFASRCWNVKEDCWNIEPECVQIGNSQVYCHHIPQSAAERKG